MKEKIALILFLILAAYVLANGQSNSWNGLTPLHSTRADVEKMFGPPKENDCRFGCEYKAGKDFISVRFANGLCDEGWNVSKDTIISFSVYLDAESGKSLDELKLDRSKFSHMVDDAVYGTWTNPVEGRTYYFGSFDKELRSKGYIPKKSDNQTYRCNGFPPYAPEGRHYPMDYLQFYNPKPKRKEGFYSIIAGIDRLAVELIGAGKDQKKAYALVYFDDKLPFETYQERLSDIKKFWLKIRKYPPDLITFIEGGMREDSLIEFYLLPNDWPPPSPDPTLPSPQFMRKQ